MTMSTPSPDSPSPLARCKTYRVLRLAKGSLKGLAWAMTILLATVLLALACSQVIQWLFGDVMSCSTESPLMTSSRSSACCTR